MLNKRLKCNENGDFTILIIADPHCENTLQWQEASDELKTLVSKAEPDFVLINGDAETNNNITAKDWEIFIAPLTARGICWSTVNGNHDPFSEDIYQIYANYPLCLNSKVSEDDENYDFERPLNYQIPIYSNDGRHIVFAIYGMDSGTVNEYGWEGFTEKQIKWYINRSEELKSKNDGNPVTSALCCHLPFTEINDMDVLHGVINEVVHTTATQNNRGYFDAIKQQGDVKIAVFGHSHTINRVGLYQDVILAYAGKVSSGSYYDELSRGGRLIRFNQSYPEKFTTSWVPALPTSSEQPEVSLYDILKSE